MINPGFPMYVEIYHTPENGAETKDTARGISGIIIIWKIVKGVQYASHNDGGDELLHGTSVILNLVKPWWNTNIILSTYSYFDFVSAVEPIFRNVLNYFGVVKTDKRKFKTTPISYIELGNSGDTSGLVRSNIRTLMSVIY